jgi:hypothetical protein
MLLLRNWRGLTGPEERYQRHPNRVLSLTVAADGIRLPEAEVRTEAVGVMRAIGPRTEHNVAAVPGEGFWAGAARSALTGMTLLAPKNVRMKTVGSAEEAVRTLGAAAAEPPSLRAHQLDALRELQPAGIRR